MHPVLNILGWTVIHSLWQITVLFLLWQVGVALFRPGHRARYCLGFMVLITSLLWSAMTCWELDEVAQTQRLEDALVVAALHPHPLHHPVEEGGLSASGSVALTDNWRELLRQGMEPYTALIAYTWLAGVLWFSVRLGGGFWLMRRLRRKGLSIPELPYRETCIRLAQKIGIQRTILFFESSYTHEPLTFGFWKPVILFPVGLMCQLHPAQVEALLLHELAHIRRHDYLFNLLQLGLEVCFFYHPLFRLVSRDVRRTRECCCDDVVLACETNRLLYAKTLTDLHLQSVHLHNQFVMNAVSSNGFTERIFSIVGTQPHKTQRSNWPLLLLPLFLLFAFKFHTAFKAPSPAAQAEFWITVPQTGGQRLPISTAALPIAASNPQTSALAFPDSSKQPVVAIGADKMNVLYIGVDNPITVAVPGYSCEELRLRFTGEGATFGAADNCQYIIRVSKSGLLKIEVLGTRKGKEVSLGVKEFRVKHIPDPNPWLGAFKGGTISKSQLIKELNNLQAIIANFDYDASCEINGFELAVIPKRAEPVIMTSNSSSLPASMIELIKSMPDSSAIFFDDIMTICPGDVNPRNIGGMAFKIIGK